ncbi:hypothetical protein C8A05DRAFT_45659 [Staphylotrichum tortipilum]|uniref:NAD(P)-binding domain-containing protein n=1 Tax=Staphylotrichum tortipilum TaxID=2831512 RepID=A0AAN6MGN3_9PEZI|nr:hypothetical protein C8A05DRAFT_45659 [Staphylotrichum longicolle]
MPGSKVLVLGGTGPAGICLVRELVFRKHEVVVYARNPSKLPEELVSNPLVEIIQGEMSTPSPLSTAVSKSHSIISLLGPDINRDNAIDPTTFSTFFSSTLFPLMREHGVRRILAMGTLSIKLPEDRWTLLQSAAILFMRTLHGNLYRVIHHIRDAFEQEGGDLDWTIFRIAQIPGGSDEESWRKDREDGEVFAGMIGEAGWTGTTRRGALAKWLVDELERGDGRWLRKLPAVGRKG